MMIRAQPVTQHLHHPGKKRHRATPSEPGGGRRMGGIDREAEGYLISESSFPLQCSVSL